MLLILMSITGLVVLAEGLTATQLVPPEIISIATGFGSGLAVLWIGKDYVKTRDALYLTVLAKHSENIVSNTLQLERLNLSIGELRMDLAKALKPPGQA